MSPHNYPQIKCSFTYFFTNIMCKAKQLMLETIKIISSYGRQRKWVTNLQSVITLRDDIWHTGGREVADPHQPRKEGLEGFPGPQIIIQYGEEC